MGPSGGCGEDLIDHCAPSRSEGILSTIVGPHGALTAVAETLEAETVRLEQLVTNLNLTLGEKRCCVRVLSRARIYGGTTGVHSSGRNQ